MEKNNCAFCSKYFIKKKRAQKFCSISCKNSYHNKSEIMRNIARNRYGEKHSAWKGENAGYFAKHIWIRKAKGKATICIKCQSNYWVEWANIDGKYKRDVNDYISLCRKCHREHDYNESKYIQLKNARANINVFRFKGETKEQAAKRLGGTDSMIDRRLKMGWSLNKAFSIPARRFTWKNKKEQ